MTFTPAKFHCSLSNCLYTQGFCTPPEETESGESAGTELVNMDAGGFDEGEGNKNISNDADPANLVRLSALKDLYVSISMKGKSS